MRAKKKKSGLVKVWMTDYEAELLKGLVQNACPDFTESSDTSNFREDLFTALSKAGIETI